MKAPHWPLETVKAAAAREDGLRFSLTRALQFFPTRTACLLAARSTVTALTQRDFVETRQQNPDVCDVYAVKKVGKGWYVKLTMLEEPDGDVVMLLSLHPLEHEIRTAAGHKVTP
jgi:hypothetical protein